MAKMSNKRQTDHARKSRFCITLQQKRGWMTVTVLFAVLASTMVLFYVQSQSRASSSRDKAETTTSLATSSSPPLPSSPYSGTFARFPAMSDTSKKYKRLTLIAQWSDDDVADYMHAFFHSVQHNADVLDLLFVNRISGPGRKCLDFAQQGMDVSWGGNIKHVCIPFDDWKERLVTFLCNSEAGWACDERQAMEVEEEVARRPDLKGWEWKPFRGPMYRDLFIHPENPLWAWIDVDSMLGDFRHFPFNILSNVSFITFDAESAVQARLLGQLTAWNMDDIKLNSIWKRFATLQTPDHFTKALAGSHQQSNEEEEWGFQYLNVDQGYPGRELDFVQLADAQGDDFFDPGLDLGVADDERHNLQYLISGRDLLLANKPVPRRYAEELLAAERDSVVEEHGWSGWSLGYDGSDTMLRDPNLSMEHALARHQHSDTHSGHFRGKLETIRWSKGEDGCPNAWWIPARWRICHPKQIHQPMLRSSFVHFHDHKPGFLFERQETDRRPRGYSRYLIKHTLRSKRYDWLQMPSMNISQSHVFTLQHDKLHVWKMGEQREEDLFARQAGGHDATG